MSKKTPLTKSKAFARTKNKFSIEAKYSAAGPWAVQKTSVNGYDLFHPANLGAQGFKHPVLTWGNGTFAVPKQYLGVLNQLASWGFVIVASTSIFTGKGSEMLAGVIYMAFQNGTADSIFYQKLDLTRVGAFGHSQGAGGAVNATNNSWGLITTTVPICLPDAQFVSAGTEFDVAKLTNPGFFLGASKDWIAPPSTLAGYYNKVAGAAAKAVLKGADHNTIQGTGGKFLGYLTAWMMYRLQGDAVARGAFVGNPPEINAETTNWQDQAEKNLP